MGCKESHSSINTAHKSILFSYFGRKLVAEALLNASNENYLKSKLNLPLSFLAAAAALTCATEAPRNCTRWFAASEQCPETRTHQWMTRFTQRRARKEGGGVFMSTTTKRPFCQLKQPGRTKDSLQQLKTGSHHQWAPRNSFPGGHFSRNTRKG